MLISHFIKQFERPKACWDAEAVISLVDAVEEPALLKCYGDLTGEANWRALGLIPVN